MDHANQTKSERSGGAGKGLAAFRRLIVSWTLDASSRKLLADRDANGESQSARVPMWSLIKKAKDSDLDQDWEEAMGALAQCAMGTPRPDLVAGMVLSSIFKEGVDVPFAALGKLVGLLEYEKSLGAPGYVWNAEGPVDGAREAWAHAKKAASLASVPSAPKPKIAR